MFTIHKLDYKIIQILLKDIFKEFKSSKKPEKKVMKSQFTVNSNSTEKMMNGRT